MEKQDLEHFRNRLLEAKGEVLNRVRKAEEYGRDEDSNGGEAMDLLDQASKTYTKEFLFSLSNADRKLLQEIDAALERIDDGTYGVCQKSGEPIGRKRLEAIPWARLSVKAQEMEEQRRVR